jgi:pimeloyl-ACP methyl ester carboxylesterase
MVGAPGDGACVGGSRTIGDMSGRRWVMMGAALAVFASACTVGTIEDADPDATTTAPPASDLTRGSTPSPPPLEWRDCGDDNECATLTVPLDYGEPAGEQIDLAVVRRTATGDRIGSLIVNPGGPGGSGVAYVRRGAADRLRDSFDVVSWDPRGVGDSRRLDCVPDRDFFTLDPEPDTDEERQALDDGARAIAAECAAADPALLPTLTTENAARDLEQLRLALGGEPLNYIGFSYGTHIGLVYAAQQPDQIRAMTLDGVVDPRSSLPAFLEGQAREAEFVLRDQLAAYREVEARVEREQLPSRAGNDVGPGDLGVAAVAALYPRGGVTILADALRDGIDGDGTALRELADTYLDASGFSAYLGVMCVDTPHPSAAQWPAFVEAMAAAAPELGAGIANELLPCAYWPVAARDEAIAPWPPTLPPILLVASTADAPTPLANAERVHDALPNSVLLVREGGGHTSFGSSPCVADAVETYFVQLTPPDKGTVCSP